MEASLLTTGFCSKPGAQIWCLLKDFFQVDKPRIRNATVTLLSSFQDDAAVGPRGTHHCGERPDIASATKLKANPPHLPTAL